MLKQIFVQISLCMQTSPRPPSVSRLRAARQRGGLPEDRGHVADWRAARIRGEHQAPDQGWPGPAAVRVPRRGHAGGAGQRGSGE